MRRRQAAGRQQYGAVSSEKRELEAEGGSLVPELEMLRFNCSHYNHLNLISKAVLADIANELTQRQDKF